MAFLSLQSSFNCLVEGMAQCLDIVTTSTSIMVNQEKIWAFIIWVGRFSRLACQLGDYCFLRELKVGLPHLPLQSLFIETWGKWIQRNSSSYDHLCVIYVDDAYAGNAISVDKENFVALSIKEIIFLFYREIPLLVREGYSFPLTQGITLPV